jgi:hypothetical protein
MKIALIVAASTGLLAAASGARANLITDGGFETVAALSSGAYQVEVSGSGASTGGTVGGWLWTSGVSSDQYNGATLVNVGDAGHGSPFITPTTQTGFGGSYVVALQGLGGVSQSFTDTTGSGSFNFSYALAGRGNETSAGNQTVNAELFDTTTSTIVYFGAVSTTGGSLFTTYSNSVNLTLGDNYTLSFAGTTNTPGLDEAALLDNVSVNVPEPSSLAVLGASLGGLALLRRRSKASVLAT